MHNIRVGDLAVVVHGLWPNIGRVVYVHKFVPDFDFSAMGLAIRTGWRVRSWSERPVLRTDGLAMVGITPTGSLRRLDRLPPVQQEEIEIQMAMEDAKNAMADLAAYFARRKILETSHECFE